MLYTRLENAIRDTPTRAWQEIAPYLEDLAADRKRLNAVHHPLGFVCLPIVRDDSPQGVCLHYWSGATGHQPTTSRYHCHSWTLLSHVLAGSVGNQRLRLIPGDQFRLYEVRSDRDDRTDVFLPTPRLTGIRGSTPEVHHAGQSYELAAGTFHTSVSTTSDVSVTLVLGRVVPGAADLSLGEATLGKHTVARLSAAPHEARRMAREILLLRPIGPEA